MWNNAKPNKHNDDKEPEPLMTRFFRGCLLLLAGVFVLWLAVHLLAQFWGWLLLLAAVIAIVWMAIWFTRWRRDRRW